MPGVHRCEACGEFFPKDAPTLGGVFRVWVAHDAMPPCGAARRSLSVRLTLP